MCRCKQFYLLFCVLQMLRKSTKRKETEVDFEEKKMNLSIGQDELDKENDYYTRTASPIMLEEGWR